MTTDAGQQQQQTKPEPMDLTKPAAADFAIAFGGGAGALQEAVNGKPAAVAATASSSQTTTTTDEGEDDPYKDVDLDALLKSKTLGPKLNSWADKAHIAQVRAAEARALETGQKQGVQQGREQLTQEQEDAFFASLSEQDLATELAGDRTLGPKYAKYLERQETKGGKGGASEEDVALAAQTLALATQIDSTLKLLNDSDLSAEVREQLKPENFVDKGAPGVSEWTAAVMAAKAKRDGEKAVAGQLTDEQEAAISRRNAADDAVRPGALPVGQKAGALPDLMKTPLKEQFDMAFGGGAPRRV